MKCPHCLVSIHIDPEFTMIGQTHKGTKSLFVGFQRCPECNKHIVWLDETDDFRVLPHRNSWNLKMVYPRSASRSPLPPEVTGPIAEDYKEACLVLADSPKASAALSRRCLQTLLHEKAGVEHRDLGKDIQEVLDLGKLPPHLAESIDAIRTIGNFAAHPIKSTSSGEIVDVEPGEAEWMLDALEGLIDFYIVQPANTQRKRDELNKKLRDAGKPPLK